MLIVPAISACTVSPAPRNGTLSRVAPILEAKSSAKSWGLVPTPPDP